MSIAAPPAARTVALVGNPNCGKSTLFNRLTGLRQRVGNYAGVTVERRIGTTADARGVPMRIIDLPGIRSLAPRSPDERIAVDVLLGRRADTPKPDAAIVVFNALHPEVGLYLLLQVRDLGIPVVACVNIADEAERAGLRIDFAGLARDTGVPVVRTVAPNGEGIEDLVAQASEACATGSADPARLPDPLHEMCERVRASWPGRPGDAEIIDALIEGPEADGIPDAVRDAVRSERATLGADAFRDAVLGARHREVEAIVAKSVRRERTAAAPDLSHRLDRVFTHPVLGLAIFLGVMGAVFFAMFWLAQWPMEWIESGISALQGAVRGDGDLRGLLADGVLAGVGAVVVFLPQIVILFLFLGLLEDTGYMARAVVLLDRPMAAVGLSGRGFVPLLGSMACAVPGVMGARVIPDRRERLATILVAPLMTCSARLPVYTLVIGTVFAAAWVQSVVMVGLYVLGAVSALAVAALLRLRRGAARGAFLVELPPYRRPTWRTTGIQLWQRVGAFLVRAGTVILGITIVLWFLSNYPKKDGAPPPLEESIAGRAGKFVEPALAPIGHDWKTGIGLLTAFFSAREVYVGTMGTVYGVDDVEESDEPLRRKLQAEADPATGAPRWTTASGISLMVFFVYAMLCSSTVVTVARESGAWRWALIQLAGMTALAWFASFAAYRIALAMGGGAA